MVAEWEWEWVRPGGGSGLGVEIGSEIMRVRRRERRLLPFSSLWLGFEDASEEVYGVGATGMEDDNSVRRVSGTAGLCFVGVRGGRFVGVFGGDGALLLLPERRRTSRLIPLGF